MTDFGDLADLSDHNQIIELNQKIKYTRDGWDCTDIIGVWCARCAAKNKMRWAFVVQFWSQSIVNSTPDRNMNTFRVKNRGQLPLCERCADEERGSKSLVDAGMRALLHPATATPEQVLLLERTFLYLCPYMVKSG